MSAVYEEKVLAEKALLKYLDGTADGKKVAVSGEAVVSEEAGETEDTHPKPEPDAAGKSFFFKGIPGMGTLLFKVTAKVLSPAPHRHTHPHVGGSPTPTLAAARLSLGMVRCVVCVCRRRWKASSTPTAWARHTAPTSTSASATTSAVARRGT